jgi:hypothetical protein
MKFATNTQLKKQKNDCLEHILGLPTNIVVVTEKLVEYYHRLGYKDIKEWMVFSSCRYVELVRIRAVLAYALYNWHDVRYSLNDVASIIRYNGMHHASVLHLLSLVGNQYHYSDIKDLVEIATSIINQRKPFTAMGYRPKSA